MKIIGLIAAIIGMILMWKGGKNMQINTIKGEEYFIAGNILCIPNAINIQTSSIVLSTICIVSFTGMAILHSIILYKAIKEEKKKEQ